VVKSKERAILPYIFLYLNPNAAEALTDQIFDMIANEVIRATASALNLAPEKISVMQIDYQRGKFASAINILGVASHTKTRAKKLVSWNEELKAAVEKLQQGAVTDEFFFNRTTEVWALLPPGSWAMVPTIVKLD
jgi:hypothetical protein